MDPFKSIKSFFRVFFFHRGLSQGKLLTCTRTKDCLFAIQFQTNLERVSLMALKERNGKGAVPGKKQRRSWKKELENGKKRVKWMKAEMGKLKADVRNVKAEGRKAKKELKDKKRELAVIKEEHRLAAEDNAGIQLCFDVMLIMLILLAEGADLVAATDELFHSFLDLIA